MGFTLTPQNESKGEFYLEVKSGNQDPHKGLEKLVNNAVSMIREFAISIR